MQHFQRSESNLNDWESIFLELIKILNAFQKILWLFVNFSTLCRLLLFRLSFFALQNCRINNETKVAILRYSKIKKSQLKSLQSWKYPSRIIFGNWSNWNQNYEEWKRNPENCHSFQTHMRKTGNEVSKPHLKKAQSWTRIVFPERKENCHAVETTANEVASFFS